MNDDTNPIGYDISIGNSRPRAIRDGAENKTENIMRDTKHAEANEDANDKSGLSPYPAWEYSLDAPLSVSEIDAVFLQITEIFGFQYDNARNMFDYFMRLLDSRASRVSPSEALKSLHADYIGGPNSNYRRWYFASGLDIDDLKFSITLPLEESKCDEKNNMDFNQAKDQWNMNMHALSSTDYVIQVALYLLCWGEANNIRFMPECMCFIFKTCSDYYYSLNDLSNRTRLSSTSFLDCAITPLYNFYRDQLYFMDESHFHLREKDHSEVIGYDDMNQLFWYKDGLSRIILENNTKLMDIPPSNRFAHLKDVCWQRVFYKTFKESRSWLPIFANFNRVWILHVCTFWYYTAYNSPTLYTKNYRYILNNKPTIQARLSVLGLAGGLAAILRLGSVLLEVIMVPRKWPGAQPVLKRSFLLFLTLVINVFPSIYLFLTHSLDEQTTWGLALAAAQFAISCITVMYLSLILQSKLFGSYLSLKNRHYLPSIYFAANIHKLQGPQRKASISLWSLIFLSKFLESYFFLTLSVRHPIRELSIMKLTNCNIKFVVGKWLCHNHVTFVLGLIIFTDLLLFVLDTYLWFIIWSTLFSVYRSLYIGFSVWTPWRNIYSRLPKRIFTKIIAKLSSRDALAKLMVSQVWNSVIIAMYRDHLISLEHVQKLIYKNVKTLGENGVYILKEPVFFVVPECQSLKSAVFEMSEAQRRITFFAQSLSTPIPEPYSLDKLPAFSVLIPHFKEKIMFSLEEIIREGHSNSSISLLEYLKLIYPLEWSCFVKDTKRIAQELDSPDLEHDSNEFYHIPYDTLGFRSATPEYILRTRIWASLHSQTLYRTISGFMNYSKALKLLYDIEYSHCEETKDSRSDRNASLLILRKFRIVASMQRFVDFTPDERRNQEFLLRAFPNLQIAYIDEEKNPDGESLGFYSVLIDSACEILEDGRRKPKYKIKLSGNPVLGDGKADNQNHAIIFARGEYVQLIDANQDHYLEECLKVRSLLAEFEEAKFKDDVYSDLEDNSSSPVAIVGAREYIFSENVGVLGDIAAGKEQTFGTLFARTFAYVGAKLHYGHPDFLNTIFMTTRGGVSKAQKGLHLNEDIYAGMNAILRGGRIKHCEYVQCGKGRDLGFNSVLSFNAKIGAGMGEQLVSREYFYLSSILPADRFFSFFYAHAGFHLNNMFISLSIFLFLIVSVNVAALKSENTICEIRKGQRITDVRRPSGCINLMPVILWLERCIFSIFIVVGISFLPLLVQELTERGIHKTLIRLLKHVASLSPLFEVFACRIYAKALMNNIAYGGARYIGTSREIATFRNSFADLYSRFGSESLYFGAKCLLMILYCSLVMWRLALVYFWVTVFALVLGPFIYNPNEFNYQAYILDYKDFLSWIFIRNRKSSTNSWRLYIKDLRIKMAGMKVKQREKRSNPKRKSLDTSGANINNIGLDLIPIFFLACAYIFSSYSSKTQVAQIKNGCLRILLVSLSPIIINALIWVITSACSMLLRLFVPSQKNMIYSSMSIVASILGLINHILHFDLLWFLQEWDISKSILGFLLSIFVQGIVFKVILTIFMANEDIDIDYQRFPPSVDWKLRKRIIHSISTLSRTFIYGTTELSLFAADFMISHTILLIEFPFLLLPGIRKWHSLMLFWFNPGSRSIVFSTKQKRKTRKVVVKYSICLLIVISFIVGSLIIPLLLEKGGVTDFKKSCPNFLRFLIQPKKRLKHKVAQNTNRE